MILSPASACPRFRRDRAMTLLAALRRREMRRLLVIVCAGNSVKELAPKFSEFDRRSNPIILEVLRWKSIFCVSSVHFEFVKWEEAR